MTKPDPASILASIEAVTEGLAATGYISTREISTAIYLAHHLRKPVLVEGPAGVGKTDLALSLAQALDQPVHRMQCYDGLDESKALYEWRYGKQLLYSQILKEKIGDVIGDAPTLEASLSKLGNFKDVFFSRDFLEPRPILRALEEEKGSVLLIDEVDKSDEEFEALLLEVLSEYQVTIPEIGTLEAVTPPIVILTSNNTRELGDALKRRCLHLHIGFPEAERERLIVRARVPDINEALLKQLVAFIQSLRDENIRKRPSISETVDWARALLLLHAEALDDDMVRDTLNVILKRQGDIDEVEPRLGKLARDAREQGG